MCLSPSVLVRLQILSQPSQCYCMLIKQPLFILALPGSSQDTWLRISHSLLCCVVVVSSVRVRESSLTTSISNSTAALFLPSYELPILSKQARGGFFLKGALLGVARGIQATLRGYICLGPSKQLGW